MGFKDRGIYLLTGVLLFGIILTFFLPAFIYPLVNDLSVISLMAFLSLAALSTAFPFIISVFLAGIYYLNIGFKKKLSNKIIFASALIYIISVPVFITAVIFGIVPCLAGPPDGLCMLYGAFILPFALLFWSIAFIVLIIGIILQFIRKRKMLVRGSS